LTSPGTTIGNYQIEERIGRGGMGVVYRGHHTKLPREVAIKSIDARGNYDLKRLRQRFEREAYVQSQLDHPGIVKIYDYVATAQTYYIVMEYVEGSSLAQVLAGEDCPLPVERALDLFEQVLVAISFAHQFVYRDHDGSTHHGIVHRDLKPGNILVTPDDRTKITDFGIVKLVDADSTDTSGPAYGSPRYVSPEQANGALLSQRSDLYSLGVILYEMVTGRPPFGSKDERLSRTEILRAHIERTPAPPSSICAEVTPELDRVILRALEKQPEDRYASAIDFLRAVRRARGRDTGALPQSPARVSSSSGKIGQNGGVRARRDDLAGTGEIGSSVADTQRESHITQPVRARVCAACGAESTGDRDTCPVCGSQLSASPATTELAGYEHEQARAKGKRLIAVFCVLALLVVAALYIRRQSRPARSTAQSAPPSPQATEPSAAQRTPLSALVQLKPSLIKVDSSFNGYSEKPLTSGITDVRRVAAMRYNQGNWASAETPDPHWIELDFANARRLAAVYVFWGFDHHRYLPSRRVELQTPDEHGEWRTISDVEPGDDYDRTAFEFDPVETSRVRILQPAQNGPKNRQFVMWVRQVQAFGLADNPPPSQ